MDNTAVKHVTGSEALQRRSAEIIEFPTPSVVSRVDEREKQAKWPYLEVKRGFDIVSSLAALIVLSPLMLLVSLAIYIDDPKGSPIFRQIRCGEDGKQFTFFKFRSMCVDAEDKLEALMRYNEADGPAFKIKDDPRITRVGKFIRRTSIDELPQLWNVLRGEMSIVGPRPPLPREVEQYTAYQWRRLGVKPGLTCFWQVQKSRNDVSFDDWIDMDLKYIRERSIGLDLKLILKTIGVVFGARGE